MQKIANTSELQRELRRLLSYAQSQRPSRLQLASACQDLSERVAGQHEARIAPTRYLPPQARDTEPVDPQGTDVSAWTYDGTDKTGRVIYYAIAFVGKQSKPIWHHSFGTRAHERDEAIQKLIDSRKARMKVKEEEQAEKRKFSTDLFMGDILYTSWGYDQTNVDWYEVVEVTGPQSVIIREIGATTRRTDSAGNDYMMPTPGDYIGPEMKKRVSPGNSIKITSFAYAHKWDGKPKYETGAHGGH
jgi:hypothetical protein